MFAILAEDKSDAEAIAHLVRRRLDSGATKWMKPKMKGYGGCAPLCAKGARDIREWSRRGVTRVIVCHDSDGNPSDEIRNKVHREVIKPSEFDGLTCIVIPVEEIEAWMIADESAINAVIPLFRFKEHSNPESIKNPKEWLISESRRSNGRPLYVPALFNPQVAEHLRFDIVAKKCRSFETFLTWLDQQR